MVLYNWVSENNFLKEKVGQNETPCFYWNVH